MTLKLKKTTWEDIGIITGIILGVMLFICAVDGLYPFGDGLVSRGDMTQQTIPAMQYYWDVLHFKASPFFAWSSGMGINIAGAFNLGGFFSPLNVFLYFVSRNSIYKFANLLVALKMACTGISMYAYLSKYRKTRLGRIIGSVLYAFGGASLVHFQIMLIMEAAFFLPLLMIGVDRIVNNRKPLFFILMLAYSFVVDIYTAGLSLVFIFIYYGVSFYLGKNTNPDRKKNTLLLGLSVIAGIGLSAFVTLPSWIAISASPRGASYSSIFFTYYAILSQELTSMDICIILRLIVNIALPFAVILYHLFVNKDTIKYQIMRYKSHLILMGLLILAMAIPAIEVFWCGGSRAYWPIRFVYVISFTLINFIVTIVDENYPDKEAWDKKDSVYILVSVLVSVVSTFIVKSCYLAPSMESLGAFADSVIGLFLEFILILAYFLLFVSKKKKIALSLVLAEIATLSMIAFYPNKELRDGWDPYVFTVTDQVSAAVNKLDTKEFHRVKNIDYKVMASHHPIIMGTEGVSNFWHVINTNSIRGINYLGYEMSYSRELDNGGTVFSDALVHDYIYFGEANLPSELYNMEETVDILNGINVYTSKYPLPLVISMDTCVLDQANNYYELQNILYRDVMGKDAALLEDISSEVKDGKITVDISGTKALYFYGDNPRENPVNLKVNGETFLFNMYEFPDEPDYLTFVESIPDFAHGIPSHTGDYSGIVCLGYYKDETVTLELSDGISDEDIHVATLDINSYIKDVNKLNSTSPEITNLKRGNSSLKMNISGINGKYILLPMAYQEGWKCQVNGKVTPIINYAGMAMVEVSESDISLDMKFTAPGTNAGIIISIITLLIAALVIFINNKTALLEAGITNIGASIADIVFMVLFYIILVIMFLIPLISHYVPQLAVAIGKIG